MKRKSSHRSAFFNLHILIALVVFLTGIFIALFATAGPWEAARQLEKQVERLTAGLQIVSAQLEASKPAQQVVANDQ
jgi:hypothetical protein